METLSGRDGYIDDYLFWRDHCVGRSSNIFADLLSTIDVDVQLSGQWPVELPEARRLVVIANHPFGIGDGAALLSIAERLNRPFKILINDGLLKIPEIRPFCLPVSFDETKAALKTNVQTGKEAIERLQAGEIIVIFPAGGVATAPRGFGRAEDLPWKTFTAKLVRQAQADVLPVFFSGQNGRLFHLLSHVSQTLRLACMIREFCKLRGGTINARVGALIRWQDLNPYTDRAELNQVLFNAVFDMRQFGNDCG